MSLKLLLQQLTNHDKIIIVNQAGEPQGVLISFEEYMELATKKPKASKPFIKEYAPPLPTPTQPKINDNFLTKNENFDTINTEILQWKNDHENPIDLEGDNVDVEDRFYLEEIVE